MQATRRFSLSFYLNKGESNEITNFSSNTNLNNQNTVTMMMKMPLGKNVAMTHNSAETLLSNKFQTLDTSPFSPPPKPTRINTTNLSLDNLSDKSSAHKKTATSVLKTNATSLSSEYDSEKMNSEEKFKSNIQYSPSKSTTPHKRSPSESNSKSDFKYGSNNVNFFSLNFSLFLFHSSHI